MNEDHSQSKIGWFHKISHLLPESKHQHTSTQDIFELINQAREQQIVNDYTANMLESLLNMCNTQVRDVMVPRGQMVLLEENWGIEQVLKVIMESGHSRYPVVDESHEQLRGILLSKDLLPLLRRELTKNDFLDNIRSAIIVPESKPLDAMLRDFRINRNHMALVIDEYGSLSGLVTIEDVIEEIVGEIDDEHDKIADAPVRSNPDGSFYVKALMPIEDFNAAFNSDLSDDDADTIGGYVLALMGKMPVSGESVSFADWQVTISKANQRRIISLHLQKKK